MEEAGPLSLVVFSGRRYVSLSLDRRGQRQREEQAHGCSFKDMFQLGGLHVHFVLKRNEIGFPTGSARA